VTATVESAPDSQHWEVLTLDLAAGAVQPFSSYDARRWRPCVLQRPAGARVHLDGLTED
jgi:hypothetical protein